MTTLICQYCKKEYTVKPYRQLTSKCCSRRCLWYITRPDKLPQTQTFKKGDIPHNKNKIQLNCLHCKRVFEKSPSRKDVAKFCSKQCMNEALKENGNAKQKYIRITVNGKRQLQHRYIMEQHLGRELHKNEVVHHINENKHDNRLDNLQLLSRSDHAKLHAHPVF